MHQLLPTFPFLPILERSQEIVIKGASKANLMENIDLTAGK